MIATPSPQTRMAPTYAEGHTRNIHRCTRFFPTTPGVVSDTPWYRTPPGCLQAPPGAVTEAPTGTNHPRVRVRHCPGVARCQDARPTMSATQ